MVQSSFHKFQRQEVPEQQSNDHKDTKFFGNSFKLAYAAVALQAFVTTTS
jgi:hypothetical protein